ncbi:MAG: hypothetical protein WC052_06175 [Patescibacteria group bacterium]
MPVPTDLTLLEEALGKLGFVEDGLHTFWNKTVWARISGRVVVFGISGMEGEAYGVLSLVEFEPSDVMEVFYHNRGVQTLRGAFSSVRAKEENRLAFLQTYCDGVMKYFNDRDVPVIWKYSKNAGSQTVGSFQIETEVRSAHDVVELFIVDVRSDFAVFLEFEGGYSILVDGDDADANCALVFTKDMLNFTPENPVERVDYSSSYHYRYIVNAIPDMLRVGVKSVYKSTSNIITTLSNMPSHCAKHFRSEFIGVMTDYQVDFKSSIHHAKKWNEQ